VCLAHAVLFASNKPRWKERGASQAYDLPFILEGQPGRVLRIRRIVDNLPGNRVP